MVVLFKVRNTDTWMMKYLKTILCALTMLTVLSYSSKAQTNQDCLEIKVKIEITDTSNGLKNGSIKVVNNDSDQEIRLHLLKVGAPRKNQLNLESLEIADIEKGDYDLVITEESGKNYCPKRERIKVN